MENLNFAALSTAKLIERIACHSDKNALNELLAKRTVFELDGRWYLLSDFLWQLKERAFRPFLYIHTKERHRTEKIDLTYDRTLQKFSVLEPTGKKATTIDGPYCNTQYRFLYQQVVALWARGEKLSAVEEEVIVARMMKTGVINQIKYSWLEACRMSNPSYARYRWKLPWGELELKRPRDMDGADFRKWLETNVDPPLANQKGVRERIQETIYRTFGHMQTVHIDEEADRNLALSREVDPLEVESQDYLQSHLYEQIANEKAVMIKEQRPAIRKLGKKGVRALVLRILDALTQPEAKDIEIVRDFKLSKATYSRFAGRDWLKNGEKWEVPDLWRNIAGVIIRDPLFFEASVRLGIIDMVQLIHKKR